MLYALPQELRNEIIHTISAKMKDEHEKQRFEIFKISNFITDNSFGFGESYYTEYHIWKLKILLQVGKLKPVIRVHPLNTHFWAWVFLFGGAVHYPYFYTRKTWVKDSKVVERRQDDDIIVYRRGIKINDSYWDRIWETQKNEMLTKLMYLKTLC